MQNGPAAPRGSRGVPAGVAGFGCPPITHEPRHGWRYRLCGVVSMSPAESLRARSTGGSEGMKTMADPQPTPTAIRGATQSGREDDNRADVR